MAAPALPGKSGGLSATNGSFVQLRVTDAESQRLEWLKAFSKDWRLVIRPPSDSETGQRWYDNPQSF